MKNNIVFDIKKIDNPKKQEKQLLKFFQSQHQDLKIIGIKINKSKTSLNSINGILIKKSKQKLFFKFHTEEDEKETINEYYNCKLLKKYKFPIIEPLNVSRIPGKQYILYPYLKSKSLFEKWEEAEETNNKANIKKLLNLEKSFCKQISKIQINSLKRSSLNKIISEPIHQLFYYRLINKKTPSRLENWYLNNQFFKKIWDKNFIINNKIYKESLKELIDKAKILLKPSNLSNMTIAAHGDDHNANKLVRGNKIYYIDPAFAGEHIPALLANIKTTFHDSYAHPYWFYDSIKASKLYKCTYKINKNTVIVSHNFKTSKERKELFNIKKKNLWQPLLKELNKRKALPNNWREHIKASLLCCAFLTKNILDKKTIPPNIAMISLCNSIELNHTAFSC